MYTVHRSYHGMLQGMSPILLYVVTSPVPCPCGVESSQVVVPVPAPVPAPVPDVPVPLLILKPRTPSSPPRSITNMLPYPPLLDPSFDRFPLHLDDCSPPSARLQSSLCSSIESHASSISIPIPIPIPISEFPNPTLVPVVYPYPMNRGLVSPVYLTESRNTISGHP